MATYNRTSSNAKRQRSKKQEVDIVDRLSDLPNSVVLHILSFLPTKDAVATGVLSKRWERLWTTVPCLNFVEGHKGFHGELETISFTNFVNRVMLENNAGTIQKFTIKCGSSNHSYDVESWIRKAINRNVEELDLDFPLTFRLPRSIFSCKTLVVLKLSGTMTIVVPKSACIPNLKTLLLDSVRYQDDNSASNLISCCLVLENLSIQSTFPDGVKNFRIYAQKLKCLRIDFDFDDQLDERTLYINAPKLEYIDMTDYASDSLSMTNVGSLLEAHVHLGKITCCKSFIKCMEAFNNVMFLSLYGYASESKITDLLLGQPGPLSVNFPKLTYFTLDVGCIWRPLLPYFLQCFENLVVLKLIKYPDYDDVGMEGARLWIEPEVTPRCLLSSLKVFQNDEFIGEDDLGMLKYILKNGKVLEKVELYDIGTRDDDAPYTTRKAEKARAFEEKLLRSEQKLRGLEQKFLMVQKILHLPRGSETCKIKFS